jgi:flagellar FliL protein
MADENALEEPFEEEEGDDKKGKKGKKKKKPKSKKKLFMMAGGGLVAVLLLGGGGAFMFGLLDGLLGIEREKTKLELDLGVPVRHPLPVIKADLKTGKCRSPFLRVEVSLVMAKEDVPTVDAKKDEIVDAVLNHLREQERQDLVRKTGAEKLRFDIANIINNVIQPKQVQGVLFKDFLLQ